MADLLDEIGSVEVDANITLMGHSNMRYTMGIWVYDSTLTDLKYSAVISDQIDWFGNTNYYRVPVGANQRLVLHIESYSNATYVDGDRYSFSVDITEYGVSTRDIYENNNHYTQAYALPNMSESFGSTYGAYLDSVNDVDWYTVDFNYDYPSLYPSFQLWGEQQTLTAKVFRVENGWLSYVGSLDNDSSRGKAFELEEPARYYIAVYTKGAETGAYTLRHRITPHYLTDESVYIYMSDIKGDVTGLPIIGSTVSRNWVKGNITCKDTKGNPAGGLGIQILYTCFAPSADPLFIMMNTDYFYTDANGKISFFIGDLPHYLNECNIYQVACARTIGDHIYLNTRLFAEPIGDFHVMNTSKYDMEHYLGTR